MLEVALEELEFSIFSPKLNDIKKQYKRSREKERELKRERDLKREREIEGEIERES